VLVSEGTLEIEGYSLDKGDGLEVSGLSSIRLKAISEAKVLLIDVPQKNRL
jgi:hypothetical protein